MTYFFTDNFKAQIALNQSLLDGASIKLVLFRFSPGLSSISPAWRASKTVAELVANPGWVEVSGISGYPLTRTITVSTRTLGGTVRNVTDGVTTSSSANVSSATINFTAADVGKQISGGTIPTGTKILSVLNTTTATMDKAATGSATSVPLAVGSGSRYVMYTDYKFDGLSTVTEVMALGVVGVASIGGVANPLIMVSTTPFDGVTNLSPADSLTSAPDSTFTDNTNRWLMSWASVTPNPVEGALVIAKGSPPFEVSGSQHVWLYPQRANMISNPSFESAAVGVGYWSTNGTLTRVAGGAGAGYWEGNVVDTTPSYVRLTGAAGSYIEGPDLAAVAGAKKFAIELDIALDDWTPTASNFIASQWSSGTANSWDLAITPSGKMSFSMYPNGAAGYSYNAVAALPYADTVRAKVGGTWLNTDGTNSTWVQTLNGVNGGGGINPIVPTGLYNSPAPIKIGAWDPAQPGAIANVYGVKIWANDVLVASPDFSGMTGTTTVDAQGNVWTLKGAAVVANQSALVVESNIFSTQMGTKFNEHWTVQLMAKGSGKLKVGLVYWDADNATFSEWGQETWNLTTSAWTNIACLRPAPNAHLAMVRLELMGSNLTIDKVLAEPGYLKDWPYFDGDEKYGARDDFSWYGGSNRAGKSYSVWYNHRQAVVGRLFARTVDPNDPTKNITDADVEEMGLVYRWVPAGITVVPHLDVFYPNDVQNPVPPKAAGVLPYSTTSTSGGASIPWTMALSLPGTSGKYVSCPDAAAFDITGDLCLMAKVTPTSWTSGLPQSIVSKWSGTQCSYQMYLASGKVSLMWSTTGANLVARDSIAGFSAATPWVAVTFDADNGNDSTVTKFWSSLDSVTWVQVGDQFNGSLSNIFPGTAAINIGGNTSGTSNLFKGLVEDVRIYSGIGNNTAPGLGTLVGHFSAKVPVVGTTYTDEVGKVWTLNGGLSYVSL